MFGPDSAIPADGVAGLSLDGRSSSDHGSEGKKEDRRVWCFCSESVQSLSITLSADEGSTSIRLASVEEVLSAKAYLCFVSAGVSLQGHADGDAIVRKDQRLASRSHLVVILYQV